MYILISHIDKVIKKHLVRHIVTASFNFLPCLDYTPTSESCLRHNIFTKKSHDNHLKLKGNLNVQGILN